MKKAGRRIGIAAAALAILAGTAATGASAATAEESTAMGGTITLRSDIGPVPYFADWPTWAVMGYNDPGSSVEAICWREGAFISDHGVAHNKWVEFASGYRTYFFWGGVLKGDEAGGITNHC